ncbi:peptide transporter [Polynucleobacter arcticus]|uniref:peptide transporter n=1 Tax=Polynucleobacter arcticus TaxID=1743165 RepID=UPI00157020D8|nr:peptide transporter [Polynucleobacter arcticus]
MPFSLEKFESYAYSGDLEMGMRELMSLLEELDKNFGGVGAQFEAQPLQALSQQEAEQYTYTRIASAASCLLANKNLFITEQWQRSVLSLHRWLAALFAATPFHTADHVIRTLDINQGNTDLKSLEIAKENLLKFCLLFTPDSEVHLELNALWEADKVLAAGLSLVLISPRFLGSPIAHSKREEILPWLASRLDQLDDIEQLPLGVLHDLYMHCSYADRADKHDIKKPINALICRKLAQNGLLDSGFSEPIILDAPNGEKPVMLVVLEWFGSSHSIYRTHSRTMESARRHFHVIAMGYENCLDEITKQVFDEFIPIQNTSMIDQLRQIQEQAKNSKALVCYMPSVGMFPLTMWLANLRVAPLQLMALGHPATTHGHAIDYVVVEEDYVGDEACFSEKLLRLPNDGMPYRPSASAKDLPVPKQLRQNPEVVQIVVCSTTMKLNPGFLQACKQIMEKSQVPVHFHFLVGQAQGLVYPNVQRVIRMFLGDKVTVYPHQSYADYMAVIRQCDLFINPFPFGNTNGIIDTVCAGLVGVCKTGPEVHEHIDQGLFERLGLPDWLITKNTDEYINAVVRLAENHEERVALSQKLSGPDKVDIFFKGRPEIFGDLLLENLNKKKQKPSAIVLQSFRQHDVPSWIARCQDSVKKFSQSRGFDYKFIGDELFDFAPDWARKKVLNNNNNLCTVADICRLEWMKQELSNYEVVIWADIDILIINSKNIDLDLTSDYGFSYELYFEENKPAQHGLNNAFMFFNRRGSMLDRYLDGTYEAISSAESVDRTALAGDLLRDLNIPESNIIHGLNILNFAAILNIYKDPQKLIPEYIASQARGSIGGANLCLNERSLYIGEERVAYDRILDEVSKTLLKAN